METTNFKRVVRGYDPEAVERTLAETERQLSESNAVNKELRLQINSLREQNDEWGNRLKYYEKIETDLREALLSTQRIANQVKEEATKQADEIIQSAQSKSEEMLGEASRISESKKLEIETMIADKRSEILQFDEQIQNLLKQKTDLQTTIDQATYYFSMVQDLLNATENSEQQAK